MGELRTDALDPDDRSALRRRPESDGGPTAGVDGTTDGHAKVLDLQRRAGNSVVQRLLAGDENGPAIDEVRDQVSAAAGFSLADVPVRSHSSVPASHGAAATTIDGAVHLGPDVHVDDPHGRHVLAHELVHVVQQGLGADPDATPGARAVLESAADVGAQSALRSAHRPTTAMTAVPAPASSGRTQHFDPRYHRESAVAGGTASGFSADEVGAIYGANWERDFSQAHPALGNVVLTWKAVKVAAFEERLTENEIGAFKGSVGTLLGIAMSPQITSLLNDESYGGYNFFEHLDNPGADPRLDESTPASATARADLLGPSKEGIPQYMVDSREYMKAQLYRAVSSYRGDLEGASSQGVAAAWAKREAAIKAEMAAAGPSGTVQSGGLREQDTTTGKTGSSVSQETSLEAGQHGALATDPLTAGASSSSAKMPGFTADVADGLGRATHTLEDFFAHSNFVELAIGEPSQTVVEAGFVKDQLGTGTFGANDKQHALAHKIRAIADEITAEKALVDRVTGRRATNPTKSEVTVGDETEVGQVDDHHHSSSPFDALGNTGERVAEEAGGTLLGGLAVGALAGSTFGPAGAIVGGLVGLGAGLLADRELVIPHLVQDIIATDAGAADLRNLAEYLEDDSRSKSSTGSHTQLAKDQPGHHDPDPSQALKSIKFELALACAKEADTQMLTMVHKAFGAADGVSANQLVEQLYTFLNSMIASPVGHPLYASIIEPKKAEAEEALRAATHNGTAGEGDLAPSGSGGTATA